MRLFEGFFYRYIYMKTFIILQVRQYGFLSSLYWYSMLWLTQMYKARARFCMQYTPWVTLIVYALCCFVLLTGDFIYHFIRYKRSHCWYVTVDLGNEYYSTQAIIWTNDDAMQVFGICSWATPTIIYSLQNSSLTKEMSAIINNEILLVMF